MIINNKTQPEKSTLHLKDSLKLINLLKDGGVDDIISLPTIAVIGIQSSGKSSVLEGLIGLDILPRSDGLCTRTPIELRLNNSKEEYALIRVVDNVNQIKEREERIENFDKLKEIILSQTDIKAGIKKNIVDKPIIITVYSPKCPDLNVIDLPGIVNNPLEGSDQPKDIDEITWNITKKYCEKENTIMLCVLASGVDITTSEILRYAKKIDMDGKRTMGVLTKLDLMNEGTSAKEALLGEQVKLGLGFVAVRNRTQKELNEMKVSIDDAYERERMYFESHPVYRKLIDYCGTRTLLSKVSKTLQLEIKKSIPNILNTLNMNIEKKKVELDGLGPGCPSDYISKKRLLNRMIDKFSDYFSNIIYGRHMNILDKQGLVIKDNTNTQYNQSNQNNQNNLYGGSLIYKKLNEFLYEESKEDYKISSILYTDNEILDKINIFNGDTFTGKISTHSFISLIETPIERLRGPVNKLLTEIEHILIEVSNESIMKVFASFPSQGIVISQYISSYIKEKTCECKLLLMRNIDILKYPYTNDLTYHVLVEKYIYDKLKERISKEVISENHENLNEVDFDFDDELALADENKKFVMKETNKRIDKSQKQNAVKDMYKDNDRNRSHVNSYLPSEKDKIEEMKMRVDVFYSVVIIRKLRDLVPNAILTIVMNEVASQIKIYLINTIEENENIIQMLVEDDENYEKRIGLSEGIRSLEELKNQIVSSPFGKTV